MMSITSMFLSVTAMAQEAATTVVAEEGASGVSDMVWHYLLMGLCGALILGVVGKILKITELTFELSGKKSAINWNLINGALCLAFLVVGMYLAFWEFGYHGKMLLPESASEHGLLTDSLFQTTLIITGFVFVAAHILLFGYAFFYRGKEGKVGYYYPHNNRLEIYWTVVPAIVLTVLVVLGFRTWNGITNPSKQAKNPTEIEVTAEQFRWTARYPGVDKMFGDHSFKLIGGINELGVNFDDTRSHDDVIVKELVLPVGKPVKFNFVAKDVIHSAYMPHFRLQMNCVPGLPTNFYFTPRITTAEMRQKLNDYKFDYVLYCAKICGAAHYNMQMKVTVVSEAEYNKWIAEQKPFYNEETKAQLAAEKKAEKVVAAAEVKEEHAAEAPAHEAPAHE